MSSKNKKIRVANIIEEARWGGPQNFITSVAEGLFDYNIETLVIMPEKDNQIFITKLEALGVEYKALKLHKLARTWRGFLSFSFHFGGDIWRVRNILKQGRIDLVHCNSASQWKGVIAAKLAGLPIVWSLHDTNSPKLVHIMFKLLAGFVKGFIPVAQRVADYYLTNDLKNKPISLIQAPVDCDQFYPNAIESDKEINQLSGFKIGLVGNINTDKDIMNYVDMAHIVHNELGEGINFFQVGGQFETQKEYISAVKAQNKHQGSDAVSLLGVKQDVRPFLAALDLYVCSSRFEASPISIWEAMAMGLPIIATNVGDVAQMNKTGDFARIVATENPADLAKTVIALINAPEERQRLGENARKYALKNLDIKICVRKHAKIYRTIAKMR